LEEYVSLLILLKVNTFQNNFLFFKLLKFISYIYYIIPFYLFYIVFIIGWLIAKLIYQIVLILINFYVVEKMKTKFLKMIQIKLKSKMTQIKQKAKMTQIELELEMTQIKLRVKMT